MTETLFGPIALFCVMITFMFGALFDKLRAAGLPCPSSLGMIMFGLILGGIAVRETEWRETLAIVDFQPDLILHIFLPVLIFDGSAGLKQKVLKQVTWNAIYLAGPGVVMGAFAVGGLGLVLYSEWTFLQSLLLGAIVAATDPVAVIAVLHDLDADPFVTVLVDGEAIMNDGSAIVLYQIVLKAIETGADALTAGDVIASICRLALVPLPLGFGFGVVMHWLTLKTLTEPLVTGTIQIAGAYIMFYVADQLCRTSGVLTLMVAGVYIARQRGRHPRSDAEGEVRAVWNQLVWCGNTLLFALVGFLIVVKTSLDVDFTHSAGWSIGRVFILYAFLNGFRAFLVATAIPLINMAATLPEDRMTWQRFIMLSFGGLRGGIAMVLSLAVLGNNELFKLSFSAEFFLNVAGVVILTSFLNGWLASPMVNLLRLNTKEIFSFYALRLALQELKHNMNSTIENLKRGAALRPHEIINWVFVRYMSVNRIEEFTLEVENDAKVHGTLTDKHTHIDAAVNARLVGKSRLDLEEGGKPEQDEVAAADAAAEAAERRNSVSQRRARPTGAAASDNNQNDNSNENSKVGTPHNRNLTTHRTMTFEAASEEVCREDDEEMRNRDQDGNEVSEKGRHEQTQERIDDACCSVFVYCKRCCAGSSDDDELDNEIAREHRRRQQELAVAAEPASPLSTKLAKKRLLNFAEDSHDDEQDGENLDHLNEAEPGEIERETTDAVDAIAEDGERISATAATNSTEVGTRAAANNNEPTDDDLGSASNNNNNINHSSSSGFGEALPNGRNHKNIALDRSKRHSSLNASKQRQAVKNSTEHIQDAETKSLKIVALLNQSRERHIMTPIVLRMIKRDLWRQYNEGLLTGATVSAFADFIDTHTRSGRLFTTEDVFRFIRGDDQLSLYDRVERYILPDQFEEERAHYYVESAIAFKTMMDKVNKTLPLLQAKQSNMVYWLAWAKLTYSMAVEHERGTFEKYPTVAVHVNSRRVSQAVIAGAMEIVPQTAAMYGLSTHQKAELGIKLFDFAFNALTCSESTSIIARIREDALRASDKEMQEEVGSNTSSSGNNGDSSPTKLQPQFDEFGNPVNFRRTKIDADEEHGKQLMELLKNTPIFYSAADEMLTEIVNSSHAQLYVDHEPIIACHHVGFVLYGNLSRLAHIGTAAAARGAVSHKRTKRFHSGDFFGLNVLVFNVARSVHFIANEETHVLWIPFEIMERCMAQDPRARHHVIISATFDVVSPVLSRAYPFSALTSTQRRSIINQAKVTRITDSKRLTDFGARDAVFIIRGKEVMPKNRALSAYLLEQNPHLLEKDANCLAVAPMISMLPEGYNGFFEEGTILVQLHDARLTSQRVPLTGMTLIDIANISLDAAWTSFTETAKQRDAYFAADVLLQELHKYMNICAGLKKVINKMMVGVGAAGRTGSIDGDSLADSRQSSPQKQSDNSLAIATALAVVVDEGDEILLVRDCIDELAQHVRVWSLQRHTGNLNRLYVSHALSAFFSLVIRRSNLWAPRLKQFVDEQAIKIDINNNNSKNNNPGYSFDWTDIESFCSNADLAAFLKDAGWYTESDFKSLHGWDRLNVEGNLATLVDIDEPAPAIISSTLHDAEYRNAIFHAKSRARLVASALRDLPAESQEVLAKQRLFGRARVQVSKGRSLPGGTSRLDVVAPVAQSERAGERGTPTEGSDFTNVATARSASDFYNPDVNAN